MPSLPRWAKAARDRQCSAPLPRATKSRGWPGRLGAIPDYPVDETARLDNHTFLQWQFRRWLSSSMRWDGSHECKSMWFELINIAYTETPVGTLPLDRGRLARMIQPNVPIDRFEELCEGTYGPLHGWFRVMCGDEIRLAHPFLTSVVLNALASRESAAARNEEASNARKRARLADDVMQIAPTLAKNKANIEWIGEFIDQRVAARGGKRRKAERITRGNSSLPEPKQIAGNLMSVGH